MIRPRRHYKRLDIGWRIDDKLFVYHLHSRHRREMITNSRKRKFCKKRVFRTYCD